MFGSVNNTSAKMDNTINNDVPAMPELEYKSTSNVVEGHKVCQTKNAMWLGIYNIYEKMHRPNTYDIGGTYIDMEPDFWFTCSIERIHGLCLLHLFAGNHIAGLHSIGVSSETLVYNVNDKVVRISGDINTYKLDCKQDNHSYVTTYSFKDADVEDILKDKKLLISIQLKVSFSMPLNPTTNILINEISENVKMNHDNESLLMDPVGSDFIIESEDGVEFPVHRTIISIQSDVFKAMLNKDMVESQNGRVKLIDVSAEDLKIMLEFIYTGTVKVIENINFPVIIMLADRYNLLGLQKLCNHILIDQLAPDTAIDTLVLADRFGYDCVKNSALQYIKEYKELFQDAKFEGVDLSLMKVICSKLLA